MIEGQTVQTMQHSQRARVTEIVRGVFEVSVCSVAVVALAERYAVKAVGHSGSAGVAETVRGILEVATCLHACSALADGGAGLAVGGRARHAGVGGVGRVDEHVGTVAKRARSGRNVIQVGMVALCANGGDSTHIAIGVSAGHECAGASGELVPTLALDAHGSTGAQFAIWIGADYLRARACTDLVAGLALSAGSRSSAQQALGDSGALHAHGWA